MTEPRTEAGKGLLTQSLWAGSPALLQWILLIEAEAAEEAVVAALSEFRDSLIAAIPDWLLDTENGIMPRSTVADAILAALLASQGEKP